MWCYALTARTTFRGPRQCFALAFDGTNVGYIGEVLQICVLHYATMLAVWAPCQVAAIHAYVYDIRITIPIYYY